MVTHRSRRDSRFARVALTAVAVWVGVALAPPARGAEDLCGATISDDLRLDQDLVCLADGLTVGADGIQINLDGHSITGAGSGVGIKIEGHSGVTIFGDGTIANFMTGVRIGGLRRGRHGWILRRTSVMLRAMVHAAVTHVGHSEHRPRIERGHRSA